MDALPVGLAAMPPGPELAVALAAVDPGSLTAHQLVTVVAAQNRQVAYQQGQLLRAVRELGLAPPQERERVVREPERNAYATVETAFATTWTGYRCEQMVNLARFAFDDAPALGEALCAGRVDLDKVKVFERALRNVTEPEVVREIVERALGKAGAETTATLRARLQRLVAKADPGSVRRRRERDHKDRFVFHFPEPSGMVMLQLRFCDPVAAAAATENLDALAKATVAAGDARGRTMDQLRHDIALDLLAGVDLGSAGIATPSQRKGAVVLHVDLATLVGPWPAWAGLAAPMGIDQPGEIAGYGPVTAHIARQAAAQLAQVSTWRYAVSDDGQLIAEGALPKNLVPGLVEQMRRWSVDVTAGPRGRNHRTPSAAQVAFVRARDRRCQAPGCRVPAHKCQIDHRIPWIKGGPTFVDNLHCLCLRHHRAKDDGGHSYRPVDGGIVWTTAAGHSYPKAADAGRRRRRRHHGSVNVLVALRGHT